MIKRKPADASTRRGDAGSAQAPRLRPQSGGPDWGPRLDTVRELARIAAEFELEEIEYDPDGRIRISRRNQAAAAPLVSAPSLPAAPALAVLPSASSPAAASAAAADAGALFITSPFVGTFYRSPSPEAASFIDLGQDVRKGQVVCIIEAMKLMNEIESDVDGKVSDVLVKNGEHVEYGQPLFRIAKA